VVLDWDCDAVALELVGWSLPTSAQLNGQPAAGVVQDGSTAPGPSPAVSRSAQLLPRLLAGRPADRSSSLAGGQPARSPPSTWTRPAGGRGCRTAGRRASSRAHRVDTASAAPLGPHPRCRGRHQLAAAAGPVPTRLGALPGALRPPWTRGGGSFMLLLLRPVRHPSALLRDLVRRRPRCDAGWQMGSLLTGVVSPPRRRTSLPRPG
jgi:hypothetical protein